MSRPSNSYDTTDPRDGNLIKPYRFPGSDNTASGQWSAPKNSPTWSNLTERMKQAVQWLLSADCRRSSSHYLPDLYSVLSMALSGWTLISRHNTWAFVAILLAIASLQTQKSLNPIRKGSAPYSGMLLLILFYRGMLWCTVSSWSAGYSCLMFAGEFSVWECPSR